MNTDTEALAPPAAFGLHPALWVLKLYAWYVGLPRNARWVIQFVVGYCVFIALFIPVWKWLLRRPKDPRDE